VKSTCPHIELLVDLSFDGGALTAAGTIKLEAARIPKLDGGTGGMRGRGP